MKNAEKSPFQVLSKFQSLRFVQFFAKATLCFAATIAFPQNVLAEGTVDFLGMAPPSTPRNVWIDLKNTVLNVHIEENDQINWLPSFWQSQVQFSSQASSPNSIVVASGSGTKALPGGEYKFEIIGNGYDTSCPDNQYGCSWSIGVQNSNGQDIQEGRVYSKRWVFRGVGNKVDFATNSQFFVKVPSENDDYRMVEVNFEGITANDSAKVALRAAEFDQNKKDFPSDTNINAYQNIKSYEIFLRPPGVSQEPLTFPTKPSFILEKKPSAPNPNCASITDAPNAGGTFKITVAGTSNKNRIARSEVICTAETDPSIPVAESTPVFVISTNNPYQPNGNLLFNWNGKGEANSPINSGTYRCMVRVYAFPLLVLFDNTEVLYKGFTLYRLEKKGGVTTKVPLRMWWNDSGLANFTKLPVGYRVPRSIETGVLSADYGSQKMPFSKKDSSSNDNTATGNSRAWGDFLQNGGVCSNCSGHNSTVVTYTFLSYADSEEISFNFVRSGLDTDKDGLSDLVEACLTKTDPRKEDSDGDGVNDYDECPESAAPNFNSCPDTDGDGKNDANDTCGDGRFWSGHETCDDGNETNLDGCNSKCKVEPNSVCTKSGCKINECKIGLGPCGEHANCIDTDDSYDCVCKTGYVLSGGSCVENILPPPCRNNNCRANATCVPKDDSYSCQCWEGYELNNDDECVIVAKNDGLEDSGLYVSGSLSGCSSTPNRKSMPFIIIFGLFYGLLKLRRRD